MKIINLLFQIPMLICCVSLNAEESSSNEKVSNILNDMNKQIVAVKNKAIKDLEREMINETKKGNLDTANRIKDTLDGLKKDVLASEQANVGKNKGQISINRKILDAKIQFIGPYSNSDKWITDDKINAANNGEDPKVVRNGDLVAAEMLFNEPLVLYGHPVSKKVPGFVDFASVTNGLPGTFVLKMRNWPTGDLKATVMVDGKDTETYELRNDEWKSYSVKLNNQKIKIRIDATGWWCEQCVFTYDIIK